jgi:flagellar basal-body rod protein FlgC
MLNAISTALSGMAASLKRLETGASNIANMGTSGAINGSGKPPYEAQSVRLTANGAGGVQAEAVPKDPAVMNAYDPDSPFADEDGIVGVPAVSMPEEAMSMKLASFSYKANLQTIKAADEMQDDLLRLLDEEA